jgi:hypothetical protein
MSREPSEQIQRRADQMARQARVGILRNPNAPPRIPPRRAQLMGRWADLRSSRRPPPPVDDPAPELAVAAPSVLRELSGLDMETLLAEVAQRETGAPLRSRYGGVWRLDPAQRVDGAASPPRADGSGLPPDADTADFDPADGGTALDWLPLDDPAVDAAVDPVPPADPPVKPRARRLGLLLVAVSALGVAGFWITVGLVVMR